MESNDVFVYKIHIIYSQKVTRGGGGEQQDI